MRDSSSTFWKERIEPHRIAGNRNGEGGFYFPDQELTVIASWGDKWDHVSVSRRDRVPTWDEMSFIKNLFFEDYEVVMELHVKRKSHINIHPYCLHLWKPQQEQVPTPPTYMV